MQKFQVFNIRCFVFPVKKLKLLEEIIAIIQFADLNIYKHSVPVTVTDYKLIKKIMSIKMTQLLSFIVDEDDDCD